MATTNFTDTVTLTAAAWFDDVDSTAYAVLTGVAGTNTITATGPINYAYAAARTPVYFVPAATNTGATTINITPSGGAALGARNVFFNGAACAGGELVSGTPAALIDDGTRFHIISSTLPATQAQQETATHVGVMVTPGRQQFHPSSSKFWLKSTGNSTTIDASYNITSIADDDVGDITITIATDFSSGNWAAVPSVLVNADGVRNAYIRSIAAGTFSSTCVDSANAPIDPTNWFFIGFGDQA